MQLQSRGRSLAQQIINGTRKFSTTLQKYRLVGTPNKYKKKSILKGV